MGVRGVVCGAGGALGRAVVAEFVRRGDHVVGVGRSVERLRAVAEAYPGAVEGEAADLTDPDQVESLWKRIDSAGAPPAFLVNVTGGFRAGAVLQTSAEDYRFMLGLNLDTAWWSCRAAARRMRDAGGGAIVNIAARSAIERGGGSAGYAVAKAGVVKLTQVLAQELEESGIRVNAVLPALIDTPANRAAFPPDKMERAVPPEAIARVIAFLCSEDAWPIAGAAIPVYGRY
ncbi:MAG: SDR family oxidoreductase [Actinomycetota bacterium]